MSRLSNPQFMYHVAPKDARQSIEDHGLHPRFDQTGYDVIYLSVSPLGSDETTDTWKVYVKGLNLLSDESTPGFEGDWYMTDQPIPAERMRLMEPEHELDQYGDIYARIGDNHEEEHEKGLWIGSVGSAREEAWENSRVAQDSVEYDWPTQDDVKEASYHAVDNHQGFRDENLLGAAIGAAQFQQSLGGQNDPFVLAAHLINNIQRQQGLVEGNKRTAILTGLGFLEANGIDTDPYELEEEGLGKVVLEMAEGQIDPDGLAQWMKQHILADKTAAMVDWEGPSEDPKDFEPGQQVEYLWSNRPMFGYIMDGPVNEGDYHNPTWMWRVRFEDGNISTVRDSYLIPAEKLDFEPGNDDVDIDTANELWPDTFPKHWGGVTDFGQEFTPNLISFVYDSQNDELYLGRNHMAILWKMKEGDSRQRYGPSFSEIKNDWDNYSQPGFVFGWITQDLIEIYSDLAGYGRQKVTDDDVYKAIAAIKQEFRLRQFTVNDRRDEMIPDTPPIPTGHSDDPQQQSISSVILSDVDTSNLQSMLMSDPAASSAYDALTQAGGQVYIVGGAVRDAALGNEPHDIDLMVTGLDGDQISTALGTVGRVDYTGKAFGVYRLRSGGSDVEVAMPRTEQSTGAAHTDFTVNADPNISVEDDLKRRDFTVNAMAYDPATDSIIDPHGGQADAQAGNLSLVNPNAFADDPLRIARGLVAVSKHGLTPDQDLMNSMTQHAPSLRELPGERIQMEMDKLLAGKNPSAAIKLAYQTGTMDYFAPELSAMEGFDQKNPHHDLPVDQHTMAVLDHMTKISNDPDMRLAALFHDSGKPESFWQDESKGPDGGGHFYKKVNEDGTTQGADHQDVGARLAGDFMNRNRYPKARTQRVQNLVQQHMFPYPKTEKAARKFLANAGDEKTAWDLLKLRESDSSGKNDATESEYDRAARQKTETLLRQVIEKEQATSVRDLAVNGHDLMQAGLRGPEIGAAQKRLLDLVMENPELNTKETLLGMI